MNLLNKVLKRPNTVTTRDSVVLITGAGSGIGRLMALEAARRGATAVLIWDLNEKAAKVTASEVEALGASSRGYGVDVTKADEVKTSAADVLKEFRRVDILINNAGIVTGKDFLDLTDEDVSRTFEVNTIAHYRVTRQFLPQMLERDYGSVVTVASPAGLIGVARQTDYSASKFASVGFAESLRAELRHRGSKVHTLVFCPYYISTGLFEGVKTRFPFLLPILEPQSAALSVIDAIEKGTQMRVMPGFVRLAQIMRPMPVPIIDAVADFFGINSTMDGFTGRKKEATRAENE